MISIIMITNLYFLILHFVVFINMMSEVSHDREVIRGDDYVVTELTHDEVVCRARDMIAYVHWPHDRTKEQVLEEMARAREHAGQQFKIFALLRGGGGGDVKPEDILSSCEVFSASACILRHNSMSKFDIGGIATVITESQHARNGYASRMLKIVQKQVMKCDQNQSRSVLFSDVGAKIYERLGYVVIDVDNRVLHFDASPSSCTVDEVYTDNPDTVSAIKSDMERWNIEYCQHLSVSGGLPKDDKSAVLFLFPLTYRYDQSYSYLNYERIAERYGRKRPSCIGARVGSTRMIWFGGDVLDIVSVMYDWNQPLSVISQQIDRLIQYAQHVAYDAHIARVGTWYRNIHVDVASTLWPMSRAHVSNMTCGLPMITDFQPKPCKYSAPYMCRLAYY